MSRLIRAASLLAAVALTSACGAAEGTAPGEDVAETSAAAAAAAPTTSWGRAYADWTQVQGHTYTNWEQEITIVEANTHVVAGFFGAMFYGPNWLLTVQRQTDAPPIFFFSMYSASGMQAPPGGSCLDGGYYRSCTMPVGEEVVGKTIKLALIKSNQNTGTDLWWSAWAQIKNGRGFYLGQLKTPYQGAIKYAYNYTDALGTTDWQDPDNIVFCVKPPERTTVVYGAPIVSSPALSRRPLRLMSAHLTGCYGASSLAAPFYDGAVHFFGP